jgi:ABC-2 type transport system ATP-binding protein
VLLDEPTSALDPVGRREVRDLIRSLRADGLTVFINSHLLSEVEMVCDRVAIVAQGRVVRAGRLEELLDAASLRVTLDRVDDGLLQTLGRIAPVANVEETTLTLEAEAEVAPLIAEAVIRGGYRLFGLVPVHRSLEDVFMQLVEEGES